LLLSGAITGTWVLVSNKNYFSNKQNWHVWIFFSFYVWLLFHFYVLATNTAEQLYDLKGDWARAFLASLTGIALGLLIEKSKTDRSKRVLELLFIAGISGTIAIYVGRYMYEVGITGQLIHTDFYMVPYLGKTPLVVFGSVLLAGLFAKLSTDLVPAEKTKWYLVSIIAILCVCMSYYFSNTKNGFIVFILIVATYAFKRLKSRKGSRVLDKVAMALIFLALAGFLKVHIDANPSWLNFYADIKAGHDIEHNLNWQNSDKYPLPLNENGKMANGSTYERSAWATAGIVLVQEHPLGYGLINHSFGALALERWPDFYKPVGKYRHASHSGWLDFTLGFGLPGLLLILLPMWVSFCRATNRTDFWLEFVHWSVPVVMVVYAITEVCTAHFIEFLFFYIALICGITAKKPKS
jgi:hypothetical protein